MSHLWERIRNVFSDELLQQGPYEHAYSAGLARGQELAADKIQQLEEHVRKTGDYELREGETLADFARQILTQGRSEVGEQLTEKLHGMAGEIRSQWLREITEQPHDQAKIHAEFTGRVAAYNELASLVHDLDNTGRIDVQWLPEILDSESVSRGVLAVASAQKERLELSQSTIQSSDPQGSRLVVQSVTPSDVLSPEQATHRLAETQNGTAFLTGQDQLIREEWQRDLQSGTSSQHDLETYFAGKVDQHNTVIEMAVKANPELQETLPPQINYEQLRDALQQQVAERQKVSANALGMAI